MAKASSRPANSSPWCVSASHHNPTTTPGSTCWTTEQLEPYLSALEQQQPDALPLYGIPFAIKDNIDLAGIPTTAGCPDYAYTPDEHAFVVARLIAAGAIPIGKTNLDQFATGLVGTRSPYGAAKNSFDPDYMAGGSSSGSALAVAMGQVSFALGTDTAGSGRVPAAFNNLVGIKPTRGLLSTQGVVPACRSLDCVSIFALDCADARRVFEVAAVYDAEDAYARPQPVAIPAFSATTFRFGVPRADQLQFFGNEEYARLFALAVERLEALGGTRVEIDFEPFLEAARLLYEGPWVTERYVAIEDFLRDHPTACTRSPAPSSNPAPRPAPPTPSRPSTGWPHAGAWRTRYGRTWIASSRPPPAPITASTRWRPTPSASTPTSAITPIS
jgi:allophanate hydrolase